MTPDIVCVQFAAVPMVNVPVPVSRLSPYDPALDEFMVIEVVNVCNAAHVCTSPTFVPARIHEDPLYTRT